MRDRDHDLIEAGLNEAAGCFDAMGKVARAWWRDCSDGGRAIDAKRCFGKDDPADRVLGARSTSGLCVDGSGAGIAAIDRHSWPSGDGTRGKLGGGEDENRQR
ncbi:MAG TPA: hypothetical protein VFW56_09445 [Bradyrhizobium sp.]|nr:hypothetical protein [Bradyrhizobium sp.]